MRSRSAPAPAPTATSHGARLVVEHLRYSYVAGQRLLDDIDFAVEPGRTVAVVGATASGKSTLTALLARLVDPDGGRVLLDGIDLRDLDRGQLAGVEALVPQTAFLFDDDVRGNVTLGMDVSDEDVWAALRAAQADGFVAALAHGLDTKLGERGTSLSGGQRQRISLARALVRRPRLLVLDDATSAVDPEVEARILSALREQDTDSTLVVVAYRKATIALADEVVHLEDGRIVDRGTHAELLAAQPVLRAAGQRLRARRAPGVRPHRARRAGGEGIAMTTLAAAEQGTVMDSGEEIAAIETIRRGIAISPELTDGIRGTLALAVVASLGQVIVPIVVQQTLDRGLNGSGGPDVPFTVLMGVVAAVAIGLTSWASYLMTGRLFTTSERGLATLRIKAFRHVHDLPLLTQNTERRGALVSRVTSDVDQVSQFLVFGGLFFIISAGQVLIATVVMLIYSWQLALVVWVAFAPLFLSLRWFQRRLSAAYGVVRRQMGTMLAAISEPVVGAAVVRSYAVEQRTQARIDEAIDEFKSASTTAQKFTVVSFSLGGISAGLANAGVIIVGIWLGFADDITAGTVVAFAFLVTLFVGPVQMGTQILTDAQNAIAGWRRVIGILDTPADLVDAGPDGEVLPARADRRPVRPRLVLLPRRPAGAPGHRPRHRGRPPGRGRRRDRLRQVHGRQAADPADGPRRGCRPARRRRRTPDRAVVDAPQRRAGAPGGVPLRRHHHRQRPLRPARRHRGRHPRQRRRARARRLAGRAPRRARHPGRPARRVALRGRAAAGRAPARPPGRPRPARARRGHQRRRPPARDADRPGARAADERPHLGHHRPPDVDRGVRRRGRGRRPRPRGPARPPRRAGRRGRRRLRRAARLLGGPAGTVPSAPPQRGDVHCTYRRRHPVPEQVGHSSVHTGLHHRCRVTVDMRQTADGEVGR